MILFAIFVFGAVIVGAGAMFAPAIPTEQPRVGLAAALALGLVIGGAVFWASLFGWDTLVIDYLLFAIVTSIFLFGTLSYGQKRAEDRGEVLLDADQGWTSGRDLLLFGLAAAVFVIPALVLPVPLDTDAQGFGYLALMAKLGGNFSSLAPFQPEITYLYSPGFAALAAYLSTQLGMGLHTIQMAIAAVLGLLNIWLAYDMGSEIRDKRLGRAMALAMLGGMALFLAYMDSHMTTLLGLVFAQACITFMLRYLKRRLSVDVVGAGLMLGATVISHPDTTIILGLGIGGWMLTMWLGEHRPNVRTWLTLLIGIPVVAALAISPWLVSVLPLLGGDIVSPFTRDASYWQVMVNYHGIVIVPLAILGAIIGLRRREQSALLSVAWLLLILDFSTTGLLESLFGGLLEPLFRYDYPFSLAWHGPIIPYTILGGMGLLWLWDRLAEKRLGMALHRFAPAMLIGAIALALVGLALSSSLLEFSKGRVGFFGAFSSHADVAAMEWIRQNTPEDALILNHPGPHEADWVPVISERESVYFRPQPFFHGTEEAEQLQQALLPFWENPIGMANADLLREAGVDYVIIPQVIAEPEALTGMFRWRPPLDGIPLPESPLTEAPYLSLVFDEQGARVYEVVGEAEAPGA
ncbi:MAG: glycosyltransferase family 39 protein [Chloroflexi bacterium]|nr:glycosyltransferase family 39 protein [Chloroflexota bacterium]